MPMPASRARSIQQRVVRERRIGGAAHQKAERYSQNPIAKPELHGPHLRLPAPWPPVRAHEHSVDGSELLHWRARVGRLISFHLIPTVLAADSFVILADLRAVIPYCRRRFGDGMCFGPLIAASDQTFISFHCQHMFPGSRCLNVCNDVWTSPTSAGSTRSLHQAPSGAGVCAHRVAFSF